MTRAEALEKMYGAVLHADSWVSRRDDHVQFLSRDHWENIYETALVVLRIDNAMEREAGIVDRIERPQDYIEGGQGRSAEKVESSGVIAFYSGIAVVVIVALVAIWRSLS